MDFPTVTIAAVAAIVFLLHQLSKLGRRPHDYPPGPPTLPFIGNLHLMPKEKGHLQFQKWAEEYGPIYSLMLGPTKVMVVLSSDTTIKELLDKRSGIYSSRPDMYFGQIVSGGFRMLLMPYGNQWRKIRALVHNSLNIKAARTYVPYQDLENKAMLLALLDDPVRFLDHIRRYTNSLTTQMIFGFRTIDPDDPRLKQLYRSFDGFSEASGSQTAALLETFPALRHLPDILLPMRRHCQELHRAEYNLFVGLYDETRQRLRAGKAKPCFCVDLVRAQDKDGFSDGIAGYVSGSLLEAGSDTTAATLSGFMQALLIYPEVVKAAQTEIDRVCGDRLPDLNDLSALQYVRGCMKESLRWCPTDLLGVPHSVTRDDEFMGYKIPKGASVIFNVWTVAHDPKRHPNPQRFDPSRWAHDRQTSAEAANNADATQRDHFVFGGGRRLCQGMHIADRSLFLAIARILWAFDVRRAVDPSTNQEIVPDMRDISEGLLIHPLPFPADIVPRSEMKARQIREEWARMAELLDDDLQWKTVPEGLVWRDYEPAETDVAAKA